MADGSTELASAGRRLFAVADHRRGVAGSPDDVAAFAKSLKLWDHDGRLRPMAHVGFLAQALDEAAANCARDQRPVLRRLEMTIDGFLASIDVLAIPDRDEGEPALSLVVAAQPGAVERMRSGYGLTRLEAEVAVELATGHVLGEIAERRGLSVMTIRGHIKSALGKLGLRRSAHLAALVATLDRGDDE